MYFILYYRISRWFYGEERKFKYELFSSNTWGEIHPTNKINGESANDLLGWSVALNKNAGRTYLTKSNVNDTLTNITNTLPSDWASETMNGISPDIPSTFFYCIKGIDSTTLGTKK